MRFKITESLVPKNDNESYDVSRLTRSAEGRLHRAALLAIIGGLMLPLAVAGCGETMSMVIQIDASNFQSVVLNSRQPVLVNFYKDG
jgi:hypothetical protein